MTMVQVAEVTPEVTPEFTPEVKIRRPVGRPRKDGLPAGSVPKKPAAARAPAPTPTLDSTSPEIVLQPQRRPRGRPRKDGRPAGSVKPVTAPTSTPLRLPSTSSPSKPGPKAGFFQHLSTENLYDVHASSPFLDTDTEGSDDTDIEEGGFESTRELLESFKETGQIDVFSGEERRREGDIARNSGIWGAEKEAGSEESNHQAELRRREMSRQRQKKECEAHGCHTEGCRFDHVKRKKVESFMEGLDERAAKLHEPVEEEAAPVPTDVSAANGADERPTNLTEVAESCESQFDILFRDIEPGNWKNWDW